MRIRSGLFCNSIYWVLLVSRQFSVPKPLSQIQRSTFLPFQEASHTPSFGGLGIKPALFLCGRHDPPTENSTEQTSHRGRMTSPESNPPDDIAAKPERLNESGSEGTEPKLSRRQMLALPIIAAAPNLTQAAKDAGIGRSTLQRWRQDENFRTAMDRITKEIAETTREGLGNLIVDGLEVINKLMQDPDPMVRLRAAQAAIILGIRVCNAEEYRNKARTTEENSPATSTDS